MPTRRNMDDPQTLEELSDIVKELSRQTREETQQETYRRQVMENLSKLGSLSVQEEGIQYVGTRIILPAVMEGNLGSAVAYINDIRQAEEEEISFGRTFPYRPHDGAAAFQRAMQLMFGTTGVGKAFWTMFGRQLPQLMSIPVGPKKNQQVPWGHVRFEPLDATFELEAYGDPKKGPLFRLDVTAPRKMRRYIEGFFDVVANELAERSIYRGKAIDASENPEFLDVYRVKREKVIYSQQALLDLNANFWGVLDHAPQMRELGQPIKRAILLAGEYGTGKTLTGALTAQHAIEAGFTFILVRAGDNPYSALKTAELYSPAVVFVEDLDVLSVGQDRTELGQLLDALDGVQAKGGEVMAAFTTNFEQLIDRAVLRPGRIDALVRIGALDEAGFQQLVLSQIPGKLLDEHLDFVRIAEAFHDYVPAFAVEAVGRAIRYSMARNNGYPDVITTEDLVGAAEGLRPQYELQRKAGEASHAKPSMEKIIAGIIQQHEVEDMGALVASDSNGS